MLEVSVSDSDASPDSERSADLPPPTRRWAWTGNFVNLSSSISTSSSVSQTQETSSRKDHLIRITGDLLYPVTADSEPTSVLPVDARSTLDAKNVDRTWAINHNEFTELVDMLYGAIDPTELLTKLTKYSDGDALPYRDMKGSRCFLINSATQILAERTGDSGKVACFQCGALIAQDRTRAHVGAHILRALVGIVEPGLREQVVATTACGFCGRNGCSIALKKTASKSFVAVTSCPRQHPFKYNTALTSSERTASTNVPILCSLCGPDPLSKLTPAFWKYAMYDHIRTHHPHNWDNTNHVPRMLDNELNKKLILSSEEFSRITKDQAPTIPIDIDLSVALPFTGCTVIPAPTVVPSKRKAPARSRNDSNSLTTTAKRPKSSSQMQGGKITSSQVSS